MLSQMSTDSTLNFSYPRRTPIFSSIYSTPDRDRPFIVGYINIELDDREYNPIVIESPPPAYRQGDMSQNRRVSLLKRLRPFERRTQASRLAEIELLKQLRFYELKNVEATDLRRLRELPIGEEREAYIRLLKEGWDFSGYYGVQFSSLESAAEIAGPEEGREFLKRVEDGWRVAGGLRRRLELERTEQRRQAQNGSFGSRDSIIAINDAE